jgi:preprotein translocase SecE subunit
MARNAGVPTRASAGAARRAFSLRLVGETVSELRRVTWPTREETMRLTIMVIAVSAVIGIFLGLVDLAFARLIDFILR